MSGSVVTIAAISRTDRLSLTLAQGEGARSGLSIGTPVICEAARVQKA
jgi:hypothetical protein